MSAPKWTTSRISYEETHSKGSKRYRAFRIDRDGKLHEGFGDTRPHAKADLRMNEVADEPSNVFHVQSTAQPQLAAE